MKLHFCLRKRCTFSATLFLLLLIIPMLFPVHSVSAHEIEKNAPQSLYCNRKDLPLPKDLLFLGDSTTYHMIARGVLQGGIHTTQVVCPKNGTLMLTPMIAEQLFWDAESGTERTIGEIMTARHPQYVIITVGLNGVHTFTESLFKVSYRKLVDAIKAASPETKILFQSIFPVAENETAWTSITPKELNQCIDKVNRYVRELAEEYDLPYLDTCRILKNGDGFLFMNDQNGDGIHLSQAGYQKILAYIANELQRLFLQAEGVTT